MKKPIRDIVKRQDWQNLREKLVGTWKEHAPENCSKLRSFLGNIKTCHEDKLRIMMNYLISSGFRHGKIKHPCISKVRGEISAEMKRRKFK
jgi:hypothetical protein